ncbi:MAG: M23 family metallopeptidase [Thermodesulfovibrionales bacterium]|nr:M23 family metallopeptidase [Thermodesulfovibrionales bacterium]
MFRMKFKRLLKRLFSPITIMLVPHDSKKPLNLKIPSVGIISVFLLWIGVSSYAISSGVTRLQYEQMETRLAYYTQQFNDIKGSINVIKEAESELTRVLSGNNKKDILQRISDSDSGSLNLEEIKQQMQLTINKVSEIKEYIRLQRNIYLSTPIGWPVEGRITSYFGNREAPRKGDNEHHSGIDISAPSGTQILATADGIVSFSGWSSGNGNVVIIEHGMGYTTLYAHNSKNLVNEGERVKRGDTIALVGSTGNSTGPHLHYEVWYKGKAVNPMKYLKEGDYVSEKK